jgi:hypothetical protein
METRINVNQICKIKIFYKSRNSWFKYKRKSKWHPFRKEGFYYIHPMDECYMTEDEINNKGNLYCEVDAVYYSPHIEIFLSNQHQITEWFSSSIKLDKFIQEYFKNIPLVTIKQ